MMRRAAALLLALAPLVSFAAPAPGTVINNQATLTGRASGFAVGSTSATVSVTVSGGPAAGYAATLVASEIASSQAGATVYLSHTLTNTGSLADTYTLSVTPFSTGGWSFTSAQLFADNNNDGLPDSATPLGPVSLLPGQAQRFVARYVVPAGAPMRTQNDARIDAVCSPKRRSRARPTA